MHDFDELLQVHFGSDDPKLRWSSAVAWAHIAGRDVPEVALAELRTWAAQYGDDSPETVWEISQADRALKVLDRVAAPAAHEIRALLVAAELAKSPKSNWHNHFNVVLDRAFPSMNQNHGRTFDVLTAAQQAVVNWLTEHPDVFGSSGPEYPLKQHGLPGTIEALKTYAGHGV